MVFPRKIAIIGLGLMGGSLAIALRRSKLRPYVIGISRSRSKINSAIRKGIISSGTTSLSSGIREADLIVIATPVRTIPPLVSRIDRFAKHGAIVTDVGSTKSEILKSINRIDQKNIRFVGSHPMAGSHKTGLEAACPHLYDGACVFVIRDRSTDRTALKKIASMWRSVGARIETVSPRRHDEIAALVSQLPHVMAMTLVNMVPAKALRFAGSGFRDSTRVAQGDPLLWIDIVRTNRRFLIRGIENFSKRLKRFAQHLRSDRKRKLFYDLSRAKRIRTQIRKLPK